VPLPIQSGSITDKVRKFFRIRGKTAFALDEIVAPVVLVQDLSKGPFQAGVTPAAGSLQISVNAAASFSIAVILNDKAGSVTPVLGSQFDERTFSFTFAEIQNINFAAGELNDLLLTLVPRSDIVAAGVPIAAGSLVSIQTADGTQTVPVELFHFDSVINGGIVWRGLLGDNTNVLGSRRTFEDIQPNITIGPRDALVITDFVSSPAAISFLELTVRGFYQQQPA